MVARLHAWGLQVPVVDPSVSHQDSNGEPFTSYSTSGLISAPPNPRPAPVRRWPLPGKIFGAGQKYFCAKIIARICWDRSPVATREKTGLPLDSIAFGQGGWFSKTDDRVANSPAPRRTSHKAPNGSPWRSENKHVQSVVPRG